MLKVTGETQNQGMFIDIQYGVTLAESPRDIRVQKFSSFLCLTSELFPPWNVYMYGFPKPNYANHYRATERMMTLSDFLVTGSSNLFRIFGFRYDNIWIENTRSRYENKFQTRDNIFFFKLTFSDFWLILSSQHLCKYYASKMEKIAKI